MHKDTPKITTRRRSPANVSKVEVVAADQALIKAHGNVTTTMSMGYPSISPYRSIYDVCVVLYCTGWDFPSIVLPRSLP